MSKSNFIFLVCVFLITCKQTPAAESGASSPATGVPSPTIGQSQETSKSLQSTKEMVVEKVKANDFDETLWGEITAEDSMTVLDIRYASTNNFTEKQIYDCPRCFLRPEVKDKLLAFRQHMIDSFGLGIILYDCYRPRPYQQRLWDIVPDERFVGNPAKGSMHNRGMAVDIGLINQAGELLDMGSDFDHFGQKSFHSATNISKEAIKNRLLLKSEIGRFGFKPITSEWWHYSYRENVMELSDWVWECD